MTRPAAAGMLAMLIGAALTMASTGVGAQAPSAMAPAASGDTIANDCGSAGSRECDRSLVKPATRSGREIYARFREGLADPSCGPDTSERWQRHFAGAPQRLAAADGELLSLFGYVVDALRAEHLPTEYALIPFVESGYRPAARSPAGPAGLWQFITITARKHKVDIRAGYDGRLSPVDSTRAAVRYLKTLHGMFAGDWRLAVMAYNAGEYRIFGALERSGQQAMHARPEKLVGLPGITRAYVRKLHALSCVLDRAEDREAWLDALDRQVVVLAPATLPADVSTLDAWAQRHDLDAAALKRLNPAYRGGRIVRASEPMRVLAPLGAGSAPAIAAAPTHTTTTTLADASGLSAATADVDTAPRSHTVVPGDSIWRLAKRYQIGSRVLLERNNLTGDSVLQPGMVLQIDPAAP